MTCRKIGLNTTDALVGIAASGSTPYVLGAVGRESEAEALTVDMSLEQEFASGKGRKHWPSRGSWSRSSDRFHQTEMRAPRKKWY